MIISIDQSLSKCAMTVMDNENHIVARHVIRTGGKVKKQDKDVTYYEDLHDQINHIVNEMLNLVVKHKPLAVVFEALAFSSKGNATRDLACLYGAMRWALKGTANFTGIVVKQYEVTPTTLKKFARQFLPEAEQFEKDSNGEFVRLKTKRKDGDDRKFCKMDKKEMVRAVEMCYGNILENLAWSKGKDDIADSILLGMYYNAHLG